ncbi:MAG: winged helix-turn-helix transcriptional regulator [Candidatus Eisenbacteria bacterium]|uniref:Winged helix-turn-helix transcriptional regulator n=1 Tax=Eiseniibacteriota bacterium TaxID=2212470 RepID=A0A7Y2EAH7_UNCEI|nr:winged helix-turn-helix transcriptional regulator [Candidatus Eisenbacteria bacterium]
MKASPPEENDVWRALADPSRREILDLLRKRSRTTNELCEFFLFSRYAVMKHLKVLEEASLIRVEREGRHRINHINPVPIQAIYRRWIKPFEKLPSDRLLRLKQIAEKGKESS